MRKLLIYRAACFMLLLLLLLYWIFNKERASGYVFTFIFFSAGALSSFFMRRFRFSYLWISVPLSIGTVSLKFSTHAFPEILILSSVMILTAALSFADAFLEKIPDIAKRVYVNIVIFVLLFEIILSIMHALNPKDIIKRKTDLFRLSPGATINNSEVNKEGYMGKSHLSSKSKRRILFIGDSFGVGVVDYKRNFIQMIEDSTDFECINLSQPGYSPLDYLEELRNKAEQTNPDLVIILIFAGNDILNLTLPENNWSFENMRSVNLIRNIMISFKAKSEADTGGSEINIEEKNFLSLERGRMAVLDEKKLESRWRIFEETAEKIIQAAKEKETPIFFVVMPDEFSVNRNLQSKLSEGAPTDWDYAAKRIKSIIEERGGSVVDVTDDLRKSYDQGINPYKERDTHLNESGNRIMYNNIKERILTLF